MTEEEILANALLFIGAGYDTTATTLSFLLYYLTVNSECQERLYAEITKTIGKQVNTYISMLFLMCQKSKVIT